MASQRGKEEHVPNWCRNRLIVFGFESEIDCEAFAGAIKGVDASDGEKIESLSFERMVPSPKDLKPAELGDWCKENWGTDRDAAEVTGPKRGDFCVFDLGAERGTLTYSFDTAWSPPRAWLATVAKKYDKLGFALVFAEEGWKVHGMALWRDGELEEDVCEEGSCLTTWIQDQLYRP
jgi:hypothetical protein